MKYMSVEIDGNGNEFETEHGSSEAAIMDAKDKWRHLSDEQKKNDRIMAVTVRDNYGEDIGGGQIDCDYDDILWDSEE